MEMWHQLDRILRFHGRSGELRCDGFGMGEDGKPVVMNTGEGFLTKTVVARKPKKDEGICPGCGGDGWDADCGGVFICPKCNGTGVVPEDDALHFTWLCYCQTRNSNKRQVCRNCGKDQSERIDHP